MNSNYSRTVLTNGLRVLTIPMEGLSSATVLVLIGAGSRYEEADKAGLSHFVEHMIFKGTKKRPTAFDISSLVDSVGGENNAFTGKDQTGFYIKIQKDRLALAFDILSDTLRDSLYLEEEIEREKGPIIEEINMYEDNPLYKIDDVFYELMFDGNPLGWSTAGEKKTVKSIKRDDFLNYVKRFYQGSDMVLAVAGNVNAEEVEKLAEEYFSSFDKGHKEKFIKFEENQTKPQIKIAYKKTDQAHIYFGFPAFSFFDPDRYALEVLSAILGGGMSSRLFIQVRERRGLAYYVRADNDTYHETGLFAARAGLNLEKVEEAVKVILDEFYKTKNGDITEKELSKSKEFLKGRTMLGLESSRRVAEWYAEKELMENQIETPAELLKNIEKVTLADVNRVAKRIFKPEKANLAVIGPFEDKEKLLNIISGK